MEFKKTNLPKEFRRERGGKHAALLEAIEATVSNGGVIEVEYNLQSRGFQASYYQHFKRKGLSLHARLSSDRKSIYFFCKKRKN